MKKDIYLITNDINSKVYVGQAKDAYSRFTNHCKPSAAYRDHELIAKAIQKYGKEHFSLTILESQIDNYNDRERYWISYYDCKAPKGYNQLDGGEAPPLMQAAQPPLQ